MTPHNVARLAPNAVDVACVYTDTIRTLDCDAAVLVTMRTPVDDLWQSAYRLGQVTSSTAHPCTLLLSRV